MTWEIFAQMMFFTVVGAILIWVGYKEGYKEGLKERMKK